VNYITEIIIGRVWCRRKYYMEKVSFEKNSALTEANQMRKLLEINRRINAQSTLSDMAQVAVQGLLDLGFDRAGVSIKNKDGILCGLWGTDNFGNVYKNSDEIFPLESIPSDSGYDIMIDREILKQKTGTDSEHIFLSMGQDEAVFESMWGYYPPCPGFYRRDDRGDNICLCIKSEDEGIGLIAVDNHLTKRLIDETSANLFGIIGTEMAKVLANAALRESLAAEKERLAVTLRSIIDGVITTDINGRIIMVNEAAEKLTGWSEEEATGKQLYEVFHIINESKRQNYEFYNGEMSKLSDNIVLIARDGTERIITDSKSIVYDGNDNKIGAVTVFRDITEKRRIEEELIRADKLETIGILAGRIAHDFNNILTGILGNVSLAKMHSIKGDRTYERLAEAEKASLRAKSLTKQLLTFSKIGNPILKITSIKDLLRDSTNFALRGSNSRCDFSIQDDLWNVEADEGQIAQVINNIVINADQSMPAGGIIRLSAENINISEKKALNPGKYVKISIKDQGIGIPKSHFPKLFDPYFTTKQKGSGLGLATAYTIINKHNGYIDLESELGIGTTFYIYLPANPDMKLEEDEIKSGEWKVLVMDDEPTIRKIAQDILGSIGYDVMVAKDGAEAVEIYKNEFDSGSPFDAVIVDLTVAGGMGGQETIKRLLLIDPKVKAIVSSGYSNNPVMSNYYEYGFKGFIPKPCRIKEMTEVLYKVITGAD